MEEVRATDPVRAPVVGEVRRPAVVDQDAFVARDDAGRVDPPAAPAVQELQGQGPVGENVEPPGPAVDPQAGLVGVQGRGFQQPRDGGLLPCPQRAVQAADVAQAGGPGEPQAAGRVARRDGPVRREHAGDGQVDDEGLQAGAVPRRAGHAVSGHPGLPGNPRDRKAAGDRKAHGILTWIHRVSSSLKRRAMGVCHGPRGKRFQRHLDESVFRRDRRRHRRASLNRLPGLGPGMPPATYRDFAGGRA